MAIYRWKSNCTKQLIFNVGSLFFFSKIINNISGLPDRVSVSLIDIVWTPLITATTSDAWALIVATYVKEKFVFLVVLSVLLGDIFRSKSSERIESLYLPRIHQWQFYQWQWTLIFVPMSKNFKLDWNFTCVTARVESCCIDTRTVAVYVRPPTSCCFGITRSGRMVFGRLIPAEGVSCHW